LNDPSEKTNELQAKKSDSPKRMKLLLAILFSALFCLLAIIVDYGAVRYLTHDDGIEIACNKDLFKHCLNPEIDAGYSLIGLPGEPTPEYKPKEFEYEWIIEGGGENDREIIITILIALDIMLAGFCFIGYKICKNKVNKEIDAMHKWLAVLVIWLVITVVVCASINAIIHEPRHFMQDH